MQETRLSFFSDGLRIAGYLMAPPDAEADPAPRPAILMLSGYGGNPHFDCIDLMRRLAADGWYVFTFDYRGHGASEGVRGRHRPLEQVQDAYDALSFMQTLPGVDADRIGVFGTSFGGAHALWVAAHDARVRCVVASAAVTDGERWLRLLRRPWEWLAFRDRVAADAQRRVRESGPCIVQRGDIMLRDPDALRQRAAQFPPGEPLPPEDIDLESAEACMRYRPEWVADRIAPRPVLMITAARDALVPPDEQLACHARLGEPKRLVTLPQAGHYDTYEFRNPAVAAVVHEETAAWFRRYL
jgi:pimeloyl-ACP methyl ester carboxylesterase